MPAAQAPKYLPPCVAVVPGASSALGFSGVLPVVLLYTAWSLVAVVSLPGGWLVALASAIVLPVAVREFTRPALFRLEWSPHRGWQCWQRGAQDGQSCTVHGVFDFQWMLLLRVRPRAGRAVWCWLRREHPTRWHRLRCAVFAVRTA